ncbi:hypothetical protein AVEN_255593-1 [Araneus ventricosus]|uniref:Uncharacterized protein n=1 Tax=Araneus ventricosus TaxID=182803 RepID=A0A4Y2RE63_ARAVE|nr:hypothetical protein AVEN_255593-1 [Araneus ventricosus]
MVAATKKLTQGIIFHQNESSSAEKDKEFLERRNSKWRRLPSLQSKVEISDKFRQKADCLSVWSCRCGHDNPKTQRVRRMKFSATFIARIVDLYPILD